MFRALIQRLRRKPPQGTGMGRRKKADRRGVALIMVLGAITVLTVFLTELQEETSAELSAATAERDALRAEYYARSAVNLSRLLIASEPTVSQSLGFITMMLGAPKQLPIWNFSDILLGPFNGEAGLASFGAVSGLDTKSAKNLGIPGGGYFDVRIIEEDSKLNINMGAFLKTGQVDLARALLSPGFFGNEADAPLFEGRDGDDQFSDRATICSALIDWSDEDENVTSCDLTGTAPSTSGVEDNFYQTVGLHYRRKNAPFDSIQELRMVRGMSREEIWSKFVDPDPADPSKRTMTPWGNKGLNVNAANAQTLLLFICGNTPPGTELCMDINQQITFISTVTLVRQFTQGIPLFGKPGDFISALEQSPKNKLIAPLLASLGIKPVKFNPQTAKRISVDSRVFSIYAEGVVPGFRKETRVRIHAVIDTRKAKPLPEVIAEAMQTGQLDGNSRIAQGDGGYKDQIKTDPGGTILYWRME